MKRQIQNLVCGKSDFRRPAVFCWCAIMMVAMTSRAVGVEPWRAIQTGELDLRDMEVYSAVNKLAKKCAIPIHLIANRQVGRKSISIKAEKDGTLGAIIDDLLARFAKSRVISTEEGIVLELHLHDDTNVLFAQAYKGVLFDGTLDEFMLKWIVPKRGWNYHPPVVPDKLRIHLRLKGNITRRALFIKAAESRRMQVLLLVDEVPQVMSFFSYDETLSNVLSVTHSEPRRSMSLSFHWY